MRATGVLLLFLAALSVFTVLSVAVMTADTFRERLHYHRLQRESARVRALIALPRGVAQQIG